MEIMEITKGDLGTGHRIIGIKEAAARLGCSPRVLYALAAGGKIQHRRLGGSVKFLYPDDLDAFIAAGVVEVA